MPPALLLLGFGRIRWLILPLPLFLLWPFLILAWVGLGLAWVVTSGRRRPGVLMAGILALRMIGDLRGTRIDTRGRDGSVYLQFV